MNINVSQYILNILRKLHQLLLDVNEYCQKQYLIKAVPSKQHQKLQEIKNKRAANCVILVYSLSSVRDYLFKLLSQNKRFNTTIIVCPMYSVNEVEREKHLLSCYEGLKERGYENIVLGYNLNTHKSIDVENEYKPDVVFFTNPYKGLIGKYNYINKFKKALTIYIPYYINNTVEYRLAYDELVHNVVWRYYVETDWHKKLSKKYSSNGSRNVVVAGYSGFDLFLDKSYVPQQDSWKIKDSKVKRIVWAPHQTINPHHTMYYSAFLLIADDMTELAKKYNGKIQFAFKPHPFLYQNLCKEWGRERTDQYYALWRSMENTTIVEGGYVDLFLTSDAIIHDSASFITEYLMVNKPALRTHNGRELKSQFNDFSIACLDNYYMAYNAKDVEDFILNVINDVDPLKQRRTEFIKKNLLPPDGKLPSEIIVNDIIDSIDNQILYRN